MASGSLKVLRREWGKSGFGWAWRSWPRGTSRPPARVRPLVWGGMGGGHGESWDSQSPQLPPDLRLSIQQSGGAGWRGLGGQLFHRGSLVKSTVRGRREHARDIEIYLWVERKEESLRGSACRPELPPVTPWWGTGAAPRFPPPRRGEISLSLPPPFTLGCGPLSEALVLPPGKRVSAFWMRASTTPTTWMEETEAKSSCMGLLRDRGGGDIRKGVSGH